MRILWQDLRYGARMLARSKGFTAAALISIALGVSVNTTIFSFINAALLRPLPVPDAERVVRVWDGDASSYPDYVAYRNETGAFAGLAAYAQRPMSLTTSDATERVWGEIVSGNYFDVLGMQPAQGRAFLPEEDSTPGSHPVAVISGRLWKSRFGSDPTLIGKTILIGNNSFTVVGITSDDFSGASLLTPPDLWVPMMSEPLVQPGSASLTSPDDGWLNMIGRLKPGVSINQAQAATLVVASRLHEARKARNSGPRDPGGRPVSVDTARGLMVSPQGRTATLFIVALLMTVVTLVLLVACANVANMLLARAAARRKEIAVRLTLGASRWRVVRQLLTESLMLSLLGGGAGLLLSMWSAELLQTLLPQSPETARASLDTSPDVRVLVYTMLLSMMTGIVFGLVPALQASKPDLVPALKDEAVGFSWRRLSLRSALVIGQVAVSLLLLVAAGLFLRNLQNTQNANPGFQVENGVVMTYDLGIANYNTARGRVFHEELLARVRALPGVRSASLAEFVPLGGGGNQSPLYVEGEAKVIEQLDEDSLLSHMTVANDYFKTMGIALTAGRDFTESDTAAGTRVVVVNETLARRITPDGNAVGKRIRMDSKGEYLEVVGVVKDTKYRYLAEKTPYFAYRPLSQQYRSRMTLHVRTATDPQAMINPLRAEVRGLDPNLPLTEVMTLSEHMRAPLAPARLLAWLSSAFGVLALVLAATGLYGVMAYLVSGRTREFGIRLALGASSKDLLRLILTEGITLVSLGMLLGLVASVALTRVLQSVLYDVSATDPLTFVSVALLLGAVTLLACYIPARRAARIDPMLALRHE
ncbi:MAG TPA: ABC transporter permease [Pyrinomonadaceae bacterium]|nr:ABC transporter permease [Pyrinomonadaceae bacterium]